jgi:arylsulfatase A-like enzyme
MMPTLADVIGAKAPSNIDGISMYNALLGKPAKVHDYFYWEFHEGGFSQAIRAGDWKLIRSKGKMLLFNLKGDLGETKDLAASQPDTVAKLTKIMNSARTESPDFPVRELKSI